MAPSSSPAAYCWMFLKNTMMRSKRHMVLWLTLLVVLCKLTLYTRNIEPITVVTIQQDRRVDSLSQTNAWSSLQVLDQERNSRNSMNILNRTFFSNGYPRTSSEKVQWSDWNEDIIFRYPQFTVPEPLFLTERDRTLFLLNEKNRAILAGSNSALTQLEGRIRIIYGGKAHWRILCGAESNLLDFVDNSEVIDANFNTGERNYTTDILVPILTPDSHSFQHFLDGVLPKIIQVLPFLRLPGVKLALLEPRDKIIKRMLAKMRLYDRVIWVKNEQVVTSRFQVNTCITPPLHPLLWLAMRHELGITTDEFTNADDSVDSGGKIILLNRAQSHNGGRIIKNQVEIAKYLVQRYGSKFVLYKPQNKLAQTKRLFADARMIIGVHGGALYNVNFAPRGCHVIELMPTTEAGGVSRRLAHTIVWRMSSAIGQKYWRLPLHPIDDQDNVYLPVDALRSVLDKIEQNTELVNEINTE